MGVRHWQLFLIFAGVAVNMSQRVNLFLTIVTMTDANSDNSEFPHYEWDTNIKANLAAALFWGNILTQIPAGNLSYKYGAKYVLLVPALICLVLCALIPICVEIGNWQLLLVVRFLQGLCQGGVYPIATAFLAQWAPKEERGLFVGFTLSGTSFGAMLTYAVGGYLAASQYGWPSVYYFSALINFVWAVFWFLFAVNTPAEHTSISEQELNYIEHGRTRTSRDDPPMPWCKIATSGPFLVVLAVHCANNWGFSTLLTQIPSYMDGVHNANIRKNGLLSALPYAAMFVLTLVFSFSNHFILKKCTFPKIYARKTYNTIGFFVPMTALLILTFAGSSSQMLSLVMLIVSVGFSSACYLGYQLNLVDLSPKFAGPLMGVTNCVANVLGVALPILLTGYIVTDVKNAAQWSIIFCITAVIYFFGNMLFLIFGVGNVQRWDEEEYQASLAVQPTNVPKV